jgi:hypothetical protein
MIMRAFAPALAISVLALMLACKHIGPPQRAADPPRQTPPQTAVTRPEFTPRAIAVPEAAKVRDTQSSWPAAKTLLITDAEEFQKMWREIYRARFPRPDIPDVDFSKEMIIAVFMGQQPTSGYSVEIVEVTEYADKIEVQIVKHRPAPDDVVTEATTSPFCLARVEKIDKPARFMEVNTGEQP